MSLDNANFQHILGKIVAFADQSLSLSLSEDQLNEKISQLSSEANLSKVRHHLRQISQIKSAMHAKNKKIINLQ